jgi:hypothetical protein
VDKDKVKQGIIDAQALMANFAELVEKCHPDWARTAKAWIAGANIWIAEIK